MTAPIIHVFTDVGVKDIDDELLMKFLCSLNSMPLDLKFIFMGSAGISPSDAMEHWIQEYEPFVKKSMNSDTKISYITISEYKELESVSCDYALQISPMSRYTGENLTVNKYYVFAGDYITPEGARPSFNREGSDTILDKFHNENKLISIPSGHMAKMLFNSELVSKFDGPFRDATVFTAFLLIFARMSTTHPANKFAEGLVNPNVGRGANYNSVMKMKEIFNIDISKIIIGDGGASLKYFTELSTKCNLVNREESEKYLYEINMILRGISDKACESLSIDKVDIWSVKPWDKPGVSNLFSAEVFVSDFNINSIPEVLKPSWEFFKTNADKLVECFNPVYDLFAGYVLVGIINGEDRTKHTREEFLKNIVTEF